MAKIVSIHSYRGGTGKSNITANIAAIAQRLGKRVAVLDTDLQSPGVHVLFGFDQSKIKLTLVDFLWGKCGIADTAYDVSDQIDPDAPGKCWLVPASLTTQAITRILDEGYDVHRLNSHFDELLDTLQLDYLLIDTHPGFNKETMLSAALSDILLITVRPDQQDYYGTAVLTEIAAKLEVPNVFIIANKVLSRLDPEALVNRVQDAFGYEVIGVLPLSEDMAYLASTRLFVREYPEHPLSHSLRRITERMLRV